ncbi:MAG TPA: fused MFS/spermidine synthase [Thermoanaerobaculia bacterium]|nr:fused MFS/spermidine synthase [Thermoanaerobaculia bacterium]
MTFVVERSRIPLLLLFFFSGISALFYQVVWLKYLGLVFGNTVFAAATLIAIYLAGLGIGGYLFSRPRPSWNPLVAYGVLEGMIGCLGSVSSNSFPLLDRCYIVFFRHFEYSPGALALSRAVLAALFLLPPTILMGGTLPLLVRWAGRQERREGRAISSLYAANTFGACAGVALAGFYTIPSFGLTWTIFAAVGGNFVLAVVAILAAFSIKTQEAEIVAPDVSGGSRGARLVLVGSLLMGLTSIADEVFWSRILVLHIGSSVYAFSLMLFSFLIGLAIGSAVIYQFIDKVSATRALALCEVTLGASLALQVHYLVRFPDVVEGIAQLSGVQDYTHVLVALLGTVLSALFIPTALMGATFPLTVKLFRERTAQSESGAVGAVYLANTVGSIAGSLLAGFVFIRLIGSQNGLFVMAAINILVGIAFWWSSRERHRLEGALIGAAVVVIVTAIAMAKPNQVILSAGLFVDAKKPILVFREDVTATVTLRQLAPDYLSLELNGVNVAGTSKDLVGTQKLQGHLPLLLHPDPHSVLHIGFGSGGTAYAVSLHPVKEIRIAEISPEVLDVSDHWLRTVNHGVLENPRVHAEINDGRNFVMASPRQFDVLLSDSIHPRYAGNGSLYTRDYFELCRKRLAPDGVISMWLPMYSLTTRNFMMILRAFHDVFPNSTVWYVPNVPNPFTIVIGRTESGPISLAQLRRNVNPAVARELAGIGIHSEYDIASTLLVDGDGIAALTASVDPHIDDRPAVEYESGRILGADIWWERTFSVLSRAATPLARAFTDVSDPRALQNAEQVRQQRAQTHLALLAKGMRY